MGTSTLQQPLHFPRHVPGLARACHAVASLFAFELRVSYLRSLTLQTCWDSVAHPPLSVFVACDCEWFLVENDVGDCGWLLITKSNVAPDLERICCIGSSALAVDLGASGRAFAAPCSWVRVSLQTLCPRAHVFAPD